MSQAIANRYAIATVVFALVAALSLIVFIAMLVTTGDGNALDVEKFTRDGNLALPGLEGIPVAAKRSP